MAEWVKRHGAIVRLTHWLNAIVLLGMIASGLQIYVAYPHFGPRGDSYPVPNPWAGGASRNGPGSAAGSRAGSIGTSPWPGRS